ncbi:hypothetical protein [Cellulomonas sp. URHB0016]
MSFNMTVAVLRDTTLDDVGVHDPAPLSFERATSVEESRLTGAQLGPDAILIDPMFGIQVAELAARLGRQAYAVTFSGVTDTYVVQAIGPVERLLVHADREVMNDEGEPLAEESALVGVDDPEDAHVAVLEALLAMPFGDLWKVEFVTLSPEPVPAP